jgi:membrane-associated PAP2 superfamily phosphatase
MKYPITLLVIAAVMLLVGIGIRMHADWKYTNKMYYRTADSRLYEFEEVFAERKIGDTVQVLSVIAGVAGGIWLVVVAIRRDQGKTS